MEYTEVWLRLVELNTERYTLTIKNCKIPKNLTRISMTPYMTLKVT